MFPVFVNDGTSELPDNDIMYIVSKEGVYLKKKLGIMESITPVKEISVLKSIEMMATMHIKPIPGTVFAPIMDFFRKVYKEHRSEAIVLLFYNEEKKTYKVIPPSQEVSGSAVDYNRAVTLEGYIMVGDIHSHANFSAFHSGVDDADEKSFDGLHITIGNNGDDEVSLSSSIVSNGQRFICQAEDYINGITKTVDIDEVVDKPYSTFYMWDQRTKKMIPKKSEKTYKVKRFDKRYVSSVSKKYQKCPDAWLALVTKKTYTYKARPGYGWPASYGDWRNWNTENFDPRVWKDQQNVSKIAPQARPPLIPATTKPVTFPPHEQKTSGPIEEILDNDFNPCKECPFSAHKIDWVMDQITEMNSDDGVDLPEHFDKDGNAIDWYECDQCDQVFSTIEEMPVCPNCKVDDFLVLLDDEDLHDHLIGDKTPADIDWYRCNTCNHIFNTTSLSPECEKCKTNDNLVILQLDGDPTPYLPDDELDPYLYKCKECGTETSTLNHGQCPFCDGDVMDIIDAEALKAAHEADEEMQNIPIPIPDDEDRIPLASTKKKRRKPGIFGTLFRKDRK